MPSYPFNATRRPRPPGRLAGPALASDAIVERAAEQYKRSARRGGQNTLLWNAMLRWAWNLDPGFAA